MKYTTIEYKSGDKHFSIHWDGNPTAEKLRYALEAIKKVLGV